jgi:DNA polymerase-3 subunit delta'
VQVNEGFEYLQRSFTSGRLAQAYVIEAPPRGAGRELADRVIQLLFCTGEPRPCGECLGCRMGLEHTNPDLLWVEPEKKSRMISVGQVRSLQQRVFQTSFANGWKVCVLVGADRLGDGAANAFLKTLEEPPPRSLFLLLTDSPQSLLPTIASRCQFMALQGGRTDLDPAWRDTLLDIVATGAGSGAVVIAFGRADRMGRLFKEMKKAAEEQETRVADEEAVDERDEVIDARVNARYKEFRAGALRMILAWYRDLLVVVHGGDTDVLNYPERLPVLEQLSARISPGKALRNVEIVETMNRQLESNLPEGLVLSQGFLGLT